MDFIEKFLIPLISAGIGAILAFRYQHSLELKRDKRAILQNLMMYRNVGANELDWIKALNVVDIVFIEHKKVRELYHTFLTETQPQNFSNGNYIETFYRLVYEMAKQSGYKDLTLHEIRDFYSPNALSIHYPNMNVGSEPSAPTEVI